MIFFNCQDSFLPTSYIEAVINNNYGSNEMNCTLLSHSISDVFLLENKFSKYIFKVYQDKYRQLEKIKEEVDILNILHQRGASVSYPIPDRIKKYIQNFNTDTGTNYGVMFTYAHGTVCLNMNNEQLATAGREMAIMHNITSELELSQEKDKSTLNSLFIDPIEKIKPAFDKLENEYHYLQKTAHEILDRIHEIDLSVFSYGYYHYDLLPNNFHFQQDGTITFFDFDHVKKGYLINDIVSFYSYYFIQLIFNRISQEEVSRMFTVFINSYRKVRPLSDAEIKAIPFFGFSFWIFYISFDCENFNDLCDPGYLKDQVSWIKKWVDYYIN